MTFKFLAIFSVLIFVPVSLHAEQTDPSTLQHTASESIEGSSIISAIKMVNLIANNSKIVLIDSRYPADRKQGYIQGSIPLPDTKTNCKSLGKHIPEKTHPVIFYCNGVRCKRSENAIKVALSCGYKKIYWFRGGFDEWLVNDFPYAKE